MYAPLFAPLPSTLPAGHTTTAFVACYAITSSVAGYVSGSLYKRSRGASWIRCLVLTATIIPVPVVAVALALNFIAMAYKCAAAAPSFCPRVLFVVATLAADVCLAAGALPPYPSAPCSSCLPCGFLYLVLWHSLVPFSGVTARPSTNPPVVSASFLG